MPNLRFVGLFAAMVIASVAGSASAGSITIQDTNRGWVKDTGQHTKGSGNLFTGEISSGSNYRSFFLFDIAGLNGIVTGGSFSVAGSVSCEGNIGSGCLVTDDPNETVLFYDVNEVGLEPIATLGSDEGNQAGINVFHDLGSGKVYGKVIATPRENRAMPEVSFRFSENLISDLNKAVLDGDKTFALGAMLTSRSTNPDTYEVLWGSSNSDLGVKLASLNVEYSERVAAVPLPASLPLLGAAFAALGFAARRGRKSRVSA